MTTVLRPRAGRRTRTGIGCLLLVLVRLAHAQVLITGAPTASISYSPFLGEGTYISLFVGGLNGAAAVESYPSSPTTPSQNVTVGFRSLSSDTVVTGSGTVCGTNCFEQGLDLTETLDISGGTTTPIGGTLSGIAGNDVFVVGTNQVVLQLAFQTSTGPVEYLDLLGTIASVIAYAACSANLYSCSTLTGAPAAGDYINSFTVNGGWAATVSTTGFQPGSSARQVYLNAANLGGSAVSWSAPANPWVPGSTSGTATTPVFTDRQRLAVHFMRFKQQQRGINADGPGRGDPRDNDLAR